METEIINGQRKSKNIAAKIFLSLIILITITASVSANIAWQNPSTNPESQVIYGTSAGYQFMLDWRGVGLPKNVWIEDNFYGAKVKEQAMIYQDLTFMYATRDIPAGTYSWNFIAKDTNGNLFSSDNYSYSVQKASPAINLLLDSEEANKLIQTNQEVNITGIKPYSNEGNIELYIDDQLIKSSNTEIDVIKKFSTTGVYEIKLKYPETQNYSTKEITRWIEVKNNTMTSQVTPASSISASSNDTNSTSTISWSNPSVSPESQVIYGTGTNYQFSTQWTSNDTLDTVTIHHNFTGNVSTDVVTNTSNSTYIYTIQNIPAGNYFWLMSANDSLGNTKTTDTFNYTIQKAEPQIVLFLNSEQSDISVDQNSTVNITGIKSGTEGQIELLIDGTVVQNDSAQIINMTKFTSAEKYNITLRYNETQNYSQKQVEYDLNVIPLILNITPNKLNYAIGELAGYTVYFPTNATVNVDVCGPVPEGSGFVQCYTQTPISETNSPYAVAHKYTNKTGKYVLNAVASYKSMSFSATANYTVDNTIATDISGDKSVYSDDQVDLTASASGGFSPYNYAWTLSNGTVITGNELSVKYNSVGTYTTKLSITDAKGNKKDTIFDINIKKWNALTILVKDKVTGNPIEGASVEIDNNIEVTNSSGLAYFKIFPGTYILSIDAYQYATLRQQIGTSSNQTLTYSLSESSSTSTVSSNDVSIDLISPNNNTYQSGTVILSAKVTTSKSASCSIYLTASKNSWSKEVNKTSVNSDTTISGQTAVDTGKDYTWFAECKTDFGTYDSETRKFTTSQKTISSATVSASGVVDAGVIRQKLEEAMQNLDALDVNSKRAAESMKLRAVLEKKLTDYDRILRDINNIQFRRDLSDAQKDAKRQEYRDNLKAIDNNTPLNISVTKSEDFINYPKKEELIRIASDYANTTKHTGTLNVDELQNLQNKISVKTSVSHVDMVMLDGTKKQITLIVKQLTYTGNFSKNDFLLESIPKYVVSSSDQITFLTTNDVVNEDPLLKFKNETSIIYYVDGYKEFDKIKTISTIAFSDSLYQSGRNSLTGNVIFANIDPASPVSLIVLLVIIILVYITYAYDLVDKVRVITSSNFKGKAVEKIVMLINDSFDSLQAGNIDQANFIFKEVKLSYENANEEVRKEVYPHATKLHDSINKAYFEKLLIAAQNGQITNEDRNRIDRAYQLLNDTDKSTHFQAMNQQGLSVR